MVCAETVTDKDGKWEVEHRKGGITVGSLVEPSATYLTIRDGAITDSSIYAIYQEITIGRTGRKISIQVGSVSGLTAQDIMGLSEQGYTVKKIKG